MPLKAEDKAAQEMNLKMTKAKDLSKLSPLDLKLEIIKQQAQAKVYLNKHNPNLKQILHN